MRQLPDGVYYELEALHEYNIDIGGRELYLVGEEADPEDGEREELGIEYMMVNRLIKNMRFLVQRSHEPILIHMKSCGGDWQEGMAVHNAIATCPAHVTILNYTHARSMTSLVLQAADKRVLMSDSICMIHDGTFGVAGTMKQVKSEWEFYKEATGRMLDIYVEAIQACRHNTIFKGWTDTKIRAKLRREMDRKEDVYLNAEDSVAWGLADEIFDGNWENLITK